jgi:hypothetical protein
LNHAGLSTAGATPEKSALASTALSVNVRESYGGHISRTGPKAGCHAPSVSWHDSGKRSRAFAGSDVILGAASSSTPTMATNPTFQLGDDLTVNRLGFGAMRITGEGIWGWPANRNIALNVLRRAIELGVNLIDTVRCVRPGNQRTADRRGASSLSERARDRDERRPDPAWTRPMGSKRSSGTPQTGCRWEPKAFTA